MATRLIINADDFGLTPGINRAIIDLHRAGVVSSRLSWPPALPSPMPSPLPAPNPRSASAATSSSSMACPSPTPNPSPRSSVPTAKLFAHPSSISLQALLRNTISHADLARETQAQIQRIQQSGIDVTHIDTHKHTHIFAAVAAPILHIARRCGVPCLPQPF